MITRLSLIHKLSAQKTPVVILNGLPGSGKSTILKQTANYLSGHVCTSLPEPQDFPRNSQIMWDPLGRSFYQHLEQVITLAAQLEEREQTLFISASWIGNNKLLSEALLYKKVTIIDQLDLMLSEQEIASINARRAGQIYLETKGWPVLVANWDLLDSERYKESLREYLRARILPSLSYQEQRLLIALSFNIHIDDHVVKLEQAHIDNLAPLIAVDRQHHYSLGIPYLRQILMDIAKSDPRLFQESMRIVAKHHFRQGNRLAAIQTAVETQNIDLAIRWFKESGSGMYGYYHGFSQLEQLLNTFPDEVIESELSLCWAKSIYLFKNQQFLEARGFIENLSLLKQPYYRHEQDRAIASLIMGKYETYFAVMSSDLKLQKLHKLEFHLASDANAMMNYYGMVSIQYSNLGDWFQAAVYQRKELELAIKNDVPYLIFYCHFNLARINLRMGYVAVAREHSKQAKRYIKRISFYHTLSFEHNFIDLIDGMTGLLSGDVNLAQSTWQNVAILRKHSEVWPEFITQFHFFGIATQLVNHDFESAVILLDQLHYEYQIRFSDKHTTLYFTLLSVLILQQQERWVEAQKKLAALKSNSTTIVGTFIELYDWLCYRNEVGLVSIRKSRNTNTLPTLPHAETAWLDICYSLQEVKLLWHSGETYPITDKLLSLLHRAYELDLWLPLMLETHWLNSALKKMKISDKKRLRYTQIEQALLAWEEKCQQSATNLNLEGLTNKQLLIVQRLAEGLSNKQIAQYCGLSESTVKFHLKNIFKQFNLSSRQSLVQLANEKGWTR